MDFASKKIKKISSTKFSLDILMLYELKLYFHQLSHVTI